jgi:hypothetical protein
MIMLLIIFKNCLFQIDINSINLNIFNDFYLFILIFFIYSKHYFFQDYFTKFS